MTEIIDVTDRDVGQRVIKVVYEDGEGRKTKTRVTADRDSDAEDIADDML